MTLTTTNYYMYLFEVAIVVTLCRYNCLCLECSLPPGVCKLLPHLPWSPLRCR